MGRRVDVCLPLVSGEIQKRGDSVHETTEEKRFKIAVVLAMNFGKCSYFCKSIFLEQADKLLNSVKYRNTFFNSSYPPKDKIKIKEILEQFNNY